jgi:hypothetical protein
LKPWAIANQDVEESNPTSDHVKLASRDQGKPVEPDGSIPWFQAIMASYKPQLPRWLETKTPSRQQQLGTLETLMLEPMVAPWEVGPMNH